MKTLVFCLIALGLSANAIAFAPEGKDATSKPESY